MKQNKCDPYGTPQALQGQLLPKRFMFVQIKQIKQLYFI